MAALPTDNMTDDAQPDSQVVTGPQVGQSVTLPALPQPERERRQRIADTWKAYKGDWGGGPLKVRKGQPDDNVRPNRCMPIVDTGVSFLFGEIVKIEINDTKAQPRPASPVSAAPTSSPVGAPDAEDATGAVDNGAALGTSPAQAYLDDCWGDDDDKMTLLSELAMNGAIAGTAFVMIVPANPKAGQKLPRLTVLDPQNVTVFPDPHDCKVVREYWIQYEVSSYDPISGKPVTLTYRKVICRNDPDGLASTTSTGYDNDDTWLILDFKRQESANTNASQAQASNAPWTCTGRTEWNKPWPPIVDCQNLPNPNEYDGLPDLPPDLIALNRSLIFAESNTSRIIKTFAHPTRWTKNVNANQLDTSIDSVLGLPSPTSEIGILEAHPDLANSMAFADNLRSDMDEQSQVPSVALGRMQQLPRGALSGVTIRALYAPLMAKTTKKRRLYGRLIRDISQHMLELGGFTAAAQATIKLHWKNPMPSDDLAAAQTALAWQQAGVSVDSSLQPGGWDVDAEAQKRAQESAQTLKAFSQGQGLPPVPPPAAAPPQDASQQSSVQQPPPGNLMHPAMVAQRQAAMQAAGKGG